MKSIYYLPTKVLYESLKSYICKQNIVIKLPTILQKEHQFSSSQFNSYLPDSIIFLFISFLLKKGNTCFKLPTQNLSHVVFKARSYYVATKCTNFVRHPEIIQTLRHTQDIQPDIGSWNRKSGCHKDCISGQIEIVAWHFLSLETLMCNWLFWQTKINFPNR